MSTIMHRKANEVPLENNRDNLETLLAIEEYDEIKKHPENYKKYSSFKDAMSEVLIDEE